VSAPDQYTLPEQPIATPVERPKELFAGVNGVIGLRAASARQSNGNRLLDVWLYGDPSAGLVNATWTLLPAPGAPVPSVTDVAIVAASTSADGTLVPSHLTLTLKLDSVPPGRGVYQLRLDPASLPTGLAIDPLRAFLPVRLRPECGDAGDCVDAAAPPAPLTPPDYDTLARDYTALRATLMERLQSTDPTADTSIADLTVTLVELFAHLGDLLHYRLDRIATECWLSTARRRANVVRHARAVDFAVQPAISAATTIQIVVAPVAGSDPQATVQPGDTATDATTIDPAAICFTIDAAGPQIVRGSHAEVALYDWAEDDAQLAAGATSAVLARPTAAAIGTAAADVPAEEWLPAGSLLAFEVVGVDDIERQRAWVAGTLPTPADVMPRPPLAGRPAQVVTVTSTAPFTDPLRPHVDLLRVFWDPAEALAVPVPCSVDQSAGAEVGVARLGLLPAHHGLLVDGPATLAPIDPLTNLTADPQATQVSDYLLVSAGPEATPGLAHAPGGRPWQLEVIVTLPNGTQVLAVRVTSMLRAPAAGFSVVIDADDEVPARLRFRTGALGLVPPSGSTVSARYQVGAGPAGNVAANVTSRLVRCTSAPGVACDWEDVTDDQPRVVTARNVTPGTGGAAAMSLDDVRRDAPQAYAAVPRRAVLISDLPPFAAAVPTVLRATARRSWSGSWPVGVVAYESVPGVAGQSADSVAAQLQAQVQSALDAVRMAGTEVVSVAATPVGILIALTVCLYPGADPAVARAAILASLRPGTPDAPGLFAPGAFRMGTDVYLSTVIAAVAALPQVDAVALTEARRLSDPRGTLETVLVMGPAEVAVCDDDPNEPDRGRIQLTVEGGR
jgi:hypothetical protein